MNYELFQLKLGTCSFYLLIHFTLLLFFPPFLSLKVETPAVTFLNRQTTDVSSDSGPSTKLMETSNCFTFDCCFGDWGGGGFWEIAFALCHLFSCKNCCVVRLPNLFWRVFLRFQTKCKLWLLVSQKGKQKKLEKDLLETPLRPHAALPYLLLTYEFNYLLPTRQINPEGCQK